jgi:hypothetical protein
MDPYLEGAEWTSVHTELSSEIARQLAPKLRPKYIVRATRRFVTDIPDDIGISTGDLFPDASIVSGVRQEILVEASVLTAAAPLEMATIMPTRIPQVTIEIRDVANRTLVTAIELLSPTNKRGEGYREYLTKRTRLLQSTAHLLEIDLLRKGKRVPMQKALPEAAYFVFLSRAPQRPITQIWPIQLNMRLPIVAVPLLPGDADCSLDLQWALNTIYDALNYDLSLDYTHPPEVSLKLIEAEWVLQRLRTAGVLIDRVAWGLSQNEAS